MVALNLNRLLKTALVGTVKLPTPADRIGSGFNADIDYPTSFLSPGQFPLPRPAEPEPRSRQEVADVMSMPPGVAPESSAAGVSGTTARRAVTRRTSAKRPGLTRLTPTSRARHPWSHGQRSQVGRDCQSPDQWRVLRNQPAAARQRGRRRTASPAAAAGK